MDTGVRDDATALILPQHAFSCVIKTMGPTKQRFTPTSGVQVQLVRQPRQPPESAATTNNNTDAAPRLWQWSIPLAVEYASQPVWSLPLDEGKEDTDDEDEEDDSVDTDNNDGAACRIVYEPHRRIATLPYGGNPQDESVAAVRQALYEQVVVRDGHQPKLNADGRPVFFFIQNAVKACYTNEGLGMAVYEWRPEFTRPNEVGIELELGSEIITVNVD